MSVRVRVCLLCSVVLMLFTTALTTVRAATVNAASCSQAHVQAAITSAINGQTVFVPAGTCTWTSSVNIPNTKGIHLQGAGIGQTIINDGVTSSLLNVQVLGGNAVTEVTGFSFNGSNISKVPTNAIVSIIGSGENRFRFHHNRLYNLGLGRMIRVIAAGGAVFSGLIDHNILDKTTSSSVQGIAIFGTDDEVDYTQFSRPVALGDSKCIYVEDNTFTWSNLSDGSTDGYSGGCIVFRYNTVVGTNTGFHGTDSGGLRGMRRFEIYGNSYTKHPNGANIFNAIQVRSGVGVIFNNTLVTGYNEFAWLQNYRSRPQSFAPWGACNGTSPWDVNTPGEEGWPCRDQVGWEFDHTQGGAPKWNPVYLWNNIHNGVIATSIIVPDAGMENHIRNGRDYYSNTQHPSYTPYTYPHPLIDGGESVAPSAPANLRIIR